jgi:hypothetical protein
MRLLVSEDRPLSNREEYDLNIGERRIVSNESRIPSSGDKSLLRILFIRLRFVRFAGDDFIAAGVERSLDVRVYFPIVTSIVLSVVLTLILRLFS